MLPEQRRDSSTWAKILDAMEDQLERSSARSLKESMSGAHVAPARETSGSFVLPANPGPIPAELVERAQVILEAQEQAIERVEAARRTTARHLATTRSMSPRRGDRAVYLDISG
ncbi:hypothetical protein [Parafrigoribacterium humi]|uniref:hypothetical protein n=1 Tax=Parafrigoribacterium humi TaxID=3144664 RepID=UPI0032EE06D5